jgi:transposase
MVYMSRTPAHGTKKALMEAKRVLEILLHERLSSSPDLNTIENVWRILKQRIKKRSRFPPTLSEMKLAVQEDWDKLQPSNFNKYIDSMSERTPEMYVNSVLNCVNNVFYYIFNL